MKKKKSKKKVPNELCERFIDALGLAANPESDSIKQLISQMNVAEKVKEAVHAKMIERYPAVKETIGKLIFESFDLVEGELLKLIEFLESDLGKKFREKHPVFSNALSRLLDEEAMTVMNSVLGLIQEDINNQMLNRGCDYKYYLPPIVDWRKSKIKS
jgi:hypothetical protein